MGQTVCWEDDPNNPNLSNFHPSQIRNPPKLSSNMPKYSKINDDNLERHLGNYVREKMKKLGRLNVRNSKYQGK